MLYNLLVITACLGFVSVGLLISGTVPFIVRWYDER